MPGEVIVVSGSQRGDEAKAGVTDRLMPEYDIGARFNGGNNAGHTVVSPSKEIYKLNSVPVSIVHEGKKSVIGNGTVINASKLADEITSLQERGIHVDDDNLLISSQAHLILPHHVAQDEIREAGDAAQGSTKRGIAQAYADKYRRVGVRAEIIRNDPDKLFEVAYDGLRALGLERDDHENQEAAKEYVERAKMIGKYVTDTVLFLNLELRKDQPVRILAEGAQAALLDIDHGMYPFVTSSSAISGGVATGLGVPGKFIKKVIGVSKAVPSHVGGGPFVTEVTDEVTLERLHGDLNAVDAETGTTTGRKRRLGYLDLPQIRRAQMINGNDEECLSKVDWVPRYGDEIPICVGYMRKGKYLTIAPDAAYKLEQSEPVYEYLPAWEEDISGAREFKDLPLNAQNFVDFLVENTGVPITMIGVGPGREQYISRKR